MKVMETTHFKQAELECKCGKCEYPGMDAEFMENLEQLRMHYGNPIILTSSYRCADYNSLVSSTGPNGPHTTGKAVDILCAGDAADLILNISYVFDFTGRGIKQNGPYNSRFIHIDTLTQEEGFPRPWLWSY